MLPKSEKLRRGQLVEVCWYDAVTEHGWMMTQEYRSISKREQPKGTPCRTAGYVVHQGKHVLSLVQTRSRDGQMATDQMSIPLGCIRSVEPRS